MNRSRTSHDPERLSWKETWTNISRLTLWSSFLGIEFCWERYGSSCSSSFAQEVQPGCQILLLPLTEFNLTPIVSSKPFPFSWVPYRPSTSSTSWFEITWQVQSKFPHTLNILFVFVVIAILTLFFSRPLCNLSNFYIKTLVSIYWNLPFFLPSGRYLINMPYLKH